MQKTNENEILYHSERNFIKKKVDELKLKAYVGTSVGVGHTGGEAEMLVGRALDRAAQQHNAGTCDVQLIILHTLIMINDC